MKTTDILLYAWIAWIVICVALVTFLESKGSSDRTVSVAV